MAILFSDDEILTLGANSGTDATNKVYEEHTVSGSVVTFPDGADGVPLKKCEITLPASLDGYSSVDVVHAKKNLLLPQNADSSSVTVNGITRSYLLSSQTFTMTGTNTKTDSAWLIFNGSDWIIDGLKKGETYTFYHNLGASMYSQITYYDTNGALKALVNLAGSAGKNNTRTFTIPSDFDRVRNFQIGVYASATDINEDAVFMLCAGSSASDFEPYQTPTTHTASLGRTIHGGTSDIIPGQGKILCGKIVFDGSESRWSAYTTGNGYAIPLTGMKRGTWYTSPLALSYPLPKAPNNDNLGVRIGVNNDGIYVVQANTIEGVTDLASFKAWLAENPLTVIYPLDDSEPFTFTPVPIDSKAGSNTIWSKQGTNVEVTYYSEREVINNYSVTATQLTAIADAIREKKRTTNPILFEDFPDEIRTIETGGGGEDAITWVYTASGSSADNYYYTAQEDGLYLAVGVRNQNTGCSISLPDGGDVVLTSTLLSPRFQMKVVRLTAGQRINLYIYNSTHVRGGWIFKLNVTPSAIAYTRAVDQYGAYTIVNQGTSNTVLSILATAWGNSYGGWDPTMKCFALSPLNSTANIRIMYGIDMTMPAIPYGGPSTCQWILNIQED